MCTAHPQVRSSIRPCTRRLVSADSSPTKVKHVLRGGQHRFRRIVGHGSPTVVPTTSARSANRPIMGRRPVDVAIAPTETHPGRQGVVTNGSGAAPGQ